MTGQQRRRHDGPQMMRVLRPVAWAALLTATAAAAAGIGVPAYAADPSVPATVPDSGAEPVPAGTLLLPGQSPATDITIPSPSASGPLADRINASVTEVSLLGEQVLELQQQRDQAEADLNVADFNLRKMRDALAEAQRHADNAAAEALKAAAAMPPGSYSRDMQDLGALNRLLTGRSTGPHPEIAGGEVERARVAEQNANAYYAAMQTKYQQLVAQVSTLETTRKTKEDALRKLRTDNIDAVEAIEREQEKKEQSLGASYISGESIAGKKANPKAMAAVRYALAQLGDPYVWAAEGPNSFDCSGLMWASYRAAGFYGLPRVARDQYYYSRNQSVSRSALLPGDLIFFASGSGWQTVHHVGMYLGNGKMVHAPTTGDVVKVSTVWWSRFYAATRIFPAVGATTPPTGGPKPPAGDPTDPPTGDPTDPTTGDPTDPPTGDPTDPPTGDPTDPPTGDPTDPPTDPPAEEPTTPPADDQTTPPAEEPTTPPADPPTETPAGVTPTDSAAATTSAATPTGTSGS